MDDALLQGMMVDRHGLEDTSPDVPAWMAEAACAGADTARWFADKGDNYTEALAVCDGCEVRGECLDHALDVEGDAGPTHRYGLWGGLTPKERAHLVRNVA